jgi:hypothetical protein
MMSWHEASLCWGPDFPVDAKGVSATSVRLVALAVAEVVNDQQDHEFYGSFTRMAHKTGLHRDTVRLAIGALVDNGVLTVLAERPGSTTLYRWVWQPPTPRDVPRGSRATPRGNPAGYPADGPDDTPRTDPTRIKEEVKGERKPVVNDRQAGELTLTPDVPTAGQRAAALRERYWAWARKEYGRAPDVNPVGLQQIVTRFLSDGIAESRLRDALKVLHRDGRPITRATIGAELDGRGPRSRRVPVAASAAALTFDADGNLT